MSQTTPEQQYLERLVTALEGIHAKLAAIADNMGTISDALEEVATHLPNDEEG